MAHTYHKWLVKRVLYTLWEKILLITNELIMQVAKLHVHTRSPFTNPVTYYLYKVSLGLLETHLFKDECSTVSSELLSEFMKNIHFWAKPKIHLKYWTMQQYIKNNIKYYTIFHIPANTQLGPIQSTQCSTNHSKWLISRLNHNLFNFYHQLNLPYLFTLIILHTVWVIDRY